MGLGLATTLKGISGGIQALGEAEQRQREEQRAQRQQDAQQLQQLIQIQQPIITELAVNNPTAVEGHVDQVKTQNRELLERLGMQDLKIFSSIGGSTDTQVKFKVGPKEQQQLFEETGVRPEIGDIFVKSINSKTGNVITKPFELTKGFSKAGTNKVLGAFVSSTMREFDILAQQAKFAEGPDKANFLAQIAEKKRRFIEEEIPSIIATGKISTRDLPQQTKQELNLALQALAATFGTDARAFKKEMETRRADIEANGLIFEEALERGLKFIKLNKAKQFVDDNEALNFVLREFGEKVERVTEAREEVRGRIQLAAEQTTAVPEQTVPPGILGAPTGTTEVLGAPSGPGLTQR